MKKENEQKKLQPNRLKRIGVSTGRTEFRAVVENGTTVEDILKADYWSLVATQFVPAGTLPRVEIIPDDVSWLIDAVVVQCGKSHAVVKVLNGPIEFGSVEEEVVSDDGLKVTYGGPHVKFRVVNAGGQVIKDGMEKDEAHTFLKSHRKAVGMQ